MTLSVPVGASFTDVILILREEGGESSVASLITTVTTRVKFEGLSLVLV